MDRAELAGWLRLSLTPGIGDGAARRLLAAFGLPENIFAQTGEALRQVVSPAQADALHQPPPGLQAQLDQTWQWLQPGHDDGGARRLVTLGDAAYPTSLLEMADPPLMLYVLGAADFELTQLGHSIAVVGSRNPTPQGAANARAFARALGEAGLPVVSGLALGVDGAAHQGALDAAGDMPRLATVAVVGTGLDRVYPARHRDLAHRITLQGLIVSELPLGTPPLTQNFPKRNRLIAGLARGTLVVEAALASGSLITARLPCADPPGREAGRIGQRHPRGAAVAARRQRGGGTGGRERRCRRCARRARRALAGRARLRPREPGRAERAHRLERRRAAGPAARTRARRPRCAAARRPVPESSHRLTPAPAFS